MVQIALAHELIHHWEQISDDQSQEIPYPDNADDIIKSRFENHPSEESRWRAGHSQRFIAKAGEVAKLLNMPLRKLLFND